MSVTTIQTLRLRTHSVRVVGLLLFGALLLTQIGCKDDQPTTTPAGGDSILISAHSLPASREGEAYALWLEMPQGSVHSIANAKGGAVQHGSFIYYKYSEFRVGDAGTVTSFTNSASSRFGDLSLASHAMISVERAGDTNTTPTAPFIAGAITGTTTEGTSTLSTADDDALSSFFTPLTATALLTAPSSAPNDFVGEVYFADRSTGQYTASIGNLWSLRPSWRYAVWTIDSSGATPVQTLLGYFTSAAGRDSKATDDAINFPGGRTPQDRTQPVTDLRGKNARVIVTLEPKTPATSSTEPSTPFGAMIFSARIPAGIPADQSFAVDNVAPNLPKATITIHR